MTANNPYLIYPGAPILLGDNAITMSLPPESHFDLVEPTMADLAASLIPGTPEHAYFEVERSRWQAARQKGDPYGLLIHFPAPGHLVNYPPGPLWELVQTVSSATLYRDLGLSGSFAEMRELIRGAVPAVAGCSVGWRIIEGLALYRVGWVKVSDRKPGHPRGNNRSPHTYAEMQGDRTKAHSIARRLHVNDPLLPISVYADGINEHNIDDFVGGRQSIGEPRATIVFDEIDHLPTKIRLRAACKRHRVTYVMITDIGAHSLVEYNDFGSQPDLPLVSGQRDQEMLDLAAHLQATPDDAHSIREMMVALVGGLENVRGEMKELLEGHGEPLISTIAQDGSTCLYGGVIAPRVLLAQLAGRPLPRRQLLDPLTGVLCREPAPAAAEAKV